MASNIYCVVLAAGESRRYGRTKLLEAYRGKPLLRHALEAAQIACPGRVCLVTGTDADAIHHAAGGLADTVVHNPAFKSGISSSIRSGVGACGEHADALLIVLADQPLVTAGHLSTLIETWESETSKIVVSAYSETIGPPVLFGRSYFGQLSELSGDSGAKSVLREHRASLRPVSFEPAAIDIDTPEDLQELPTRA
jgi:molybdenum cofactor cytidylyltransferase